MGSVLVKAWPHLHSLLLASQVYGLAWVQLLPETVRVFCSHLLKHTAAEVLTQLKR